MSELDRMRFGQNGARAFLLAAGLGTRLQPLTLRTAKCLVPIGGRPLLDYWFDRLDEAQIRDVLINTHHLAHQVREHVGNLNHDARFNLVNAHEKDLLGSAGTLTANRDFVGGGHHCLVISANSLSSVDLTALLRQHCECGAAVTMTLVRTRSTRRHDGQEMHDSGRAATRVSEPLRANGNVADAGVYALTAEAFHEIADMNVRDLARDALPSFAGRINGWLWNGIHVSIGTHEALAHARSVAHRIDSQSARTLAPR